MQKYILGQQLEGYAICNRLSFLIASASNRGAKEAEVLRKDMKESWDARGAVMHPRPTKRSVLETELRNLAEQATNWLRDGIKSTISCGYTQNIPQQIDAAIFEKALESYGSNIRQLMPSVPTMDQFMLIERGSPELFCGGKMADVLFLGQDPTIVSPRHIPVVLDPHNPDGRLYKYIFGKLCKDLNINKSNVLAWNLVNRYFTDKPRVPASQVESSLINSFPKLICC